MITIIILFLIGCIPTVLVILLGRLISKPLDSLTMWMNGEKKYTGPTQVIYISNSGMWYEADILGIDDNRVRARTVDGMHIELPMSEVNVSWRYVERMK